MSKVGKYTYYLSTRKDKKLMVNPDDKKWIHFGSKDPLMEHYFDKTGLLPKYLNHKNKERQTNYLKRSQAIKNKQGELTATDPLSANYHSINVLW